jgi:hypothetical protein
MGQRKIKLLEAAVLMLKLTKLLGGRYCTKLCGSSNVKKKDRNHTLLCKRALLIRVALEELSDRPSSGMRLSKLMVMVKKNSVSARKQRYEYHLATCTSYCGKTCQTVYDRLDQINALMRRI